MNDRTWRARAACRDMETDLFFGTGTDLATDQAKRVCFHCPVRNECLQHALEFDEQGIWAGTSCKVRRAIRKGRRRLSCPVCFSLRLKSSDAGAQICLSCGLSWRLRPAELATLRASEDAAAPTRALSA